jgi:hypothetical protein
LKRGADTPAREMEKHISTFSDTPIPENDSSSPDSQFKEKQDLPPFDLNRAAKSEDVEA